jgi:hypothetical protein
MLLEPVVVEVSFSEPMQAWLGGCESGLGEAAGHFVIAAR